jgi:hypothetical protein
VNLQETLQKHDQAIHQFYTDNSVGESIAERLKFWGSRGYRSDHADEGLALAVVEVLFLQVAYPQDFIQSDENNLGN